MKRSFVPALALALTLAAAPAGAAAAQPSDPGTNLVAPSTCTAGTGRGGAAALAALVAAAVNVGNVSACVLNDSLNNLLQNADIHVLENILNNSPILSGFTIDLENVLNDNNVLTGIEVTVIDLGGFNVPVVFILPVTP